MPKNPFDDPGPSSTSIRSTATPGLADASLGAKLGVGQLQPLPLKHFMGSFLMYLCALILLIVAAAVGLGKDGDATGAAVAGFFALLFLIPPTILLLRRGKSAGLILHEHGFVLSRGKTRKVARYEGIDTLTLIDREQLDNGRPAGRIFRVAVRGADGKLRFDHFAKPGVRDSGLDAIGRLLVSTADAAKKRIAAGTPLHGKKWRLGPEGLVDLRKKGEAPILLDRLGAVAIFAGNVAIWRGGEELPTISVPAASPNAAILRELASRAVDEKTAAPVGALGRLLVEKRPSRTIGFLLLVLGIMMLPMVVVPFFSKDVPVFAGLLVGAFGGLLAFAGSHLAFTKLRFHEAGLVKATPIGTRQILYTEIAVFTFSATRHYHNGVYTGTHFLLGFEPREGKKITFSATSRGTDDDLDFVREEVGRIVAGTLLKELKSTGSVAWGKAHRITPKTVEQLRGMLGMRKAKSIPISTLTYKVENGHLHLFTPGAKRSVASMACSVQNFWPGMVLLEHVAAELAKKSSPTAVASPAPAPAPIV